MIFTKFDKVLDVMREKDIRFFIIKDKDGTKIDELIDGDHSCEDAIAHLEDTFGELDGDWAWVRLRMKSGKETNAGGNNMHGNFDYKVRIAQEKNEKVNGFSSDVRSLMEQKNQLEIKIMRMEEEAKRKKEIEALEKKIEGIQNTDPLEKYAPLFAGIFQHVTGKPMPGVTQPINGTETEKTTAEQITPGKRINNACKILWSIDKNFPDEIEGLAKAAQKDPEKYRQFIALVKSMMPQT